MNNPNFAPNGMGQPRPQPGNGLQHFVSHYRQQLATGKVPQGWQQSVPPEERAQLCQQFFTQYRLLRNDAPDMEAMRAAVHFETLIFVQSQSKEQYSNLGKSKLHAMTLARQSRVQGSLGPMNNGINGMGGMTPAQMGAIMGQPAAQGPRQGTPQQFNPAFPNAQLQRPMQISPVPMSQGPSSMGVNSGNPANMNPDQNPQQPNIQAQQQSQIVNHFAQRIMETCNPEIRTKFEQDVQGWSEDKKQQLLAGGINPLFFRFRQHAEMLYKRGALNKPNVNGNPMQAGAQNRMPNQMGAGQRQGNQDFDMNAIANQQMEAMRVQDAGATVVPASNNMNGAQMAGFPGQNPQPGQQQQNMAQRQAQEAAAFQNTMQQQHNIQRMHNAQQQAQALQMEQQRQRQVAAARNANQLNQNQLLQGLNGGLNLPPASQSPGPMAMLNRPMHPPGQPGSATPQQQPQNHVPVMTPRPGQMNSDPQVSALMREAQQRANAVGAHNQPLTDQARMAMMPAELDPQARAQLLKLPEAQFRSMIQNHMQQRLRQNNGIAHFQGLQPNQGPPNPLFNQQSAPQPGMPNPMMSVNMGRPGMNIGQSMPGAAQQAAMGQRPQQGQQQANGQQRRVSAQNLLRQSPGIIQATDNQPYPPSVINVQLRANIPGDVKTWGQLKHWTTQNPASMASLSLEKLTILQAMHFQELVNQGKIPLNGKLQPQNAMQGLAPPAPMTPNGGIPRNPQQTLNMGGLQVTPQELQQLRQKLPPQNANVPDDYLRNFILRQKMTARQNQQAALQHQQNQMRQEQQNRMMAASQQQVSQPMPGQQQPPNRPPTAQSQNSQATPQAKANAKQQPPAPSAQLNSAASKGMKRPNDDMSEPNAEVSATSAAPQAPAMVPTRSAAGLNFTQEQMSKMTPAQQAQMKAQLLKAQDASSAAGNNKMQQQQQQQLQQQPNAGPTNEEIRQRMHDPARMKALNQLIDEVERSIPPRPQVQLPQSLRAQIQHALNQQLDKMKKLEQALRFFHSSSNRPDTENIIRQVALARALLFQQINKQDGTLLDQVTLTADEFKTHMRTTVNFYSQLTAKMASVQNASQQSQPQQGPNAPTAQLNAANLKIVEQQQRNSKAPSAPTTDRPPFAIGDQSARGAPTYFEGAKTVTNLVLPDKKRTKLDPGSQNSTPGPKASPHIGTGNGHAPELARHQPPKQGLQRPTFQCRESNCEYSVRGFDTQAELDSHWNQMHVKIENPLQFALESMAEYLDVDQKTGEPRVDPTAAKRPAAAAHAPSRATQPSKTEHTPNVQNLGTPAGAQPAVTPMARIPTQTGMKNSPVTNLLKTPQTVTKAATPGSGAQAKATPTSMPRPVPKEEPVAAPEPVKEVEQALLPMSLFDYSYEDMFAAFDANGPFTVLDLKDEDTTWALRSRPASPMTTPESSAKDTPSTRTSDISENDNLHISLDMDMPDAWLSGFNGNALPINLQISDDMNLLGPTLPAMDSDDLMLFPAFGDGMMDLDTLEKTMDSMGGFDASMLAAA